MAITRKKPKKHSRGHLWTPAHDKVLLRGRERHKTWEEIAEMLNKRFKGIKRKPLECLARAGRMKKAGKLPYIKANAKKAAKKAAAKATKKTVKKASKKIRHIRWTPPEDKYLAKLQNRGLSNAAIKTAFNKRFTSSRSASGIAKRLELMRKGVVKVVPTRASAKPTRAKKKEMSLNLGDEGSLTVTLEGDLSQDKAIQDKGAAFISEVVLSRLTVV